MADGTINRRGLVVASLRALVEACRRDRAVGSRLALVAACLPGLAADSRQVPVEDDRPDQAEVCTPDQVVRCYSYRPFIGGASDASRCSLRLSNRRVVYDYFAAVVLSKRTRRTDPGPRRLSTPADIHFSSR